MNLDLYAKSPFERVRLFLKLYSLPVFVAIFGIATYCMAYEKAYEFKAQEMSRAIKPQIAIAQETQAYQVVNQEQSALETKKTEAKNKMLGEYFVDASALNVRSQASAQAKINAKLYRSASVEVIAVDGEWAQLENGWVLLKYLSRA